uniref:hypothetical protein n=1 Tax=Actinoplanes sp. CA-151224 TaxID=3239904 RepID=UPI003F4966CB
MERTRKTALADERGRVNLGNAYAGRYFDLEHNENGTITLTPVTVLRPGELPPRLQAEVDKHLSQTSS